MTNNDSHTKNLVDLNDYLGPSQECIKPVEQVPIPDLPKPSEDKAAVSVLKSIV